LVAGLTVMEIVELLVGTSMEKEKPKLYKVHFRIDVYCCGIISYAEGHTSVLANSESEAKKKVRYNIKLLYGGSTKVYMINDFNKPSNQ